MRAPDGGGGATVAGPLVAREQAARTTRRRRNLRCMSALCDTEVMQPGVANHGMGAHPMPAPRGLFPGGGPRYDSE